MRKHIFLLMLFFLLGLCVGCSPANPEGKADPAAVYVLDASTVSGSLPEQFSVKSGELSESPCLMVGSFVAGEDSGVVFQAQLAPRLDPSGFGDIVSSCELPPAAEETPPGISDLYGVVFSIKDTEITAVFPMPEAFADVAGEGPVNEKWGEGGVMQYIMPVQVCVGDEEGYLLSLLNGDRFNPVNPLPEEIVAIATDEMDRQETIAASHCGLALFSLLSQERDGSFCIQLQAFLTLGA